MQLESITRRKNKKLQDKRLGRGYGSGVGGHTVGRGQKGQKSRSGHKSMALFEGGNLPFYKKTPKYRGFKKPNQVKYQVVNLADIDKAFKANEEVSVESLAKNRLLRKKEQNVKILGHDKLSKKLNFKNLQMSESAKKSILDVGGKIE
jgi:large subunit ribosomal protein L15